MFLDQTQKPGKNGALRALVQGRHHYALGLDVLEFWYESLKATLLKLASGPDKSLCKVATIGLKWGSQFVGRIMSALQLADVNAATC